MLDAEILTYSLAEIAKRMSVGTQLLRNLVRRGELETIQIGGRLLVPKAAFEKLLRDGAAHGRRGFNGQPTAPHAPEPKAAAKKARAKVLA